MNIALISDVLDVPQNNPSLVGFTFSESKSNIRIQVRVKSDSGWGNWQTLDEEKQEEAKNEGSEPFTVNRAAGVQMRILGDSAPSEAELGAVRKRREFPMRVTQAMQVIVQNNIVAMALKPGGAPIEPPLLVRIINAVPWLQGWTARFLAIGVRPEHVHSREVSG